MFLEVCSALAWLDRQTTAWLQFENTESMPVFLTVDVPGKQVLLRTVLLPWQALELRVDTREVDIRVSVSPDGVRPGETIYVYNMGFGEDCYVVGRARIDSCPVRPAR